MNLTNLFKSTALTLVIAGSAGAATFTYNLGNLNNLDHYNAVTWGSSFTMPSGQAIIGATITIKNIRNWTNESNSLFINLLDSATSGVSYINDDPNHTNTISNYFGGNGILLTTFQDSLFTPQQFSYSFTSGQISTLNNYVANGNNFALGFDPDCHYWNDGVCVTITTAVIPPPNTSVPDSGSSLVLLGLGMLGLAGLRRRMS